MLIRRPETRFSPRFLQKELVVTTLGDLKHIYKVRGHEKLARINPVIDAKTFQTMPPEERQEKIDTALESYRTSDAVLRSLHNTYNVSVVPMDHVVGRNQDHSIAVFTFSSIIKGENLSEILYLPPEAQQECENTLVGIFRHYRDAFRTQTNYWSDPGSDNFMYGSLASKEDAKHIWLTDADAYIHQYDPNDLDEFLSTVELAIGMLEELPTKFIPPATFAQASAAAHELLTEISASVDPKNATIHSLQKRLTQTI